MWGCSHLTLLDVAFRTYVHKDICYCILYMVDTTRALPGFPGEQAELGPEMRVSEDPRKTDMLALLSVLYGE